MQRSALCRSRRELSNEYLLAKIGVDTAENELLQVLFNIIQYYSIVSLLVRPNGRELTYQLQRQSLKDYNKKILLPLLICLIWGNGVELTQQLQNAIFNAQGQFSGLVKELQTSTTKRSN